MIGNRSARGVTLIELSIVLVIIGVLAGSVIIGRDLLESSRVRVSIKDREMILAAVNVFKERYECTPGDCPNLTDFWDNAAVYTSDSFCLGPPWGSGAPLPAGSVCNGNGDGRIEWGFPTFGNAEVHGFWHQLALAGLFTKANYTGSRIRVGSTPYIPENGGWPFTVRGGVNAPDSTMGDNVCWSVLSTSNDPPDNPMQDTFERDSIENIFTLGSAVNLPTGNIDYCYNPGFSSAMAYYFDSKIDDGKPGTGRVQGWLGGAGRTPDCLVLNTGDPTGQRELPEYNLKKDGPICSLIFRDRI